MVDRILLADAVVRAMAEGQEVFGVLDVLLTLRAEAIRVKLQRISEALQSKPSA